MNDPTRLIDETDSDLTRSLLEHARQEAPAPYVVQKTAALLAGGAALVAAPSSAAAAGASSIVTLLKWGALVAVVGGGAATAHVISERRSEPPPAVEVAGQGVSALAPLVHDDAAPVPQRSGRETHDAPSVDEAGVATPAAAGVDPVAPVSDELIRRVPAVTSRKAGQAASGTGTTPGGVRAKVVSERLAEEVALLDAARVALSRGQLQLAQRKAERYLAQYPGGRLEPEARYLRMQALERAGDRSAAQDEAEHLVREGTLHDRAAQEVLDGE